MKTLIPDLRYIFLKEHSMTGHRDPEKTNEENKIKERVITFADVMNSFNLQTLWKKDDEHMFPLTVKYYYGVTGQIDWDDDCMVVYDKDGKEIDRINHDDPRFATYQRQLFHFFHRDDG